MLNLMVMRGLLVASLFLMSCCQKSEKTDRGDSKSIVWMLDVSKGEIALPVEITENNIVDSYYLGGFGDSVMIIQVKCSPTIIKRCLNKCDENYMKAEKGDIVPERFRILDYGVWYEHKISPSVDYHVLFSKSDSSSMLIERVKS